MKTVFSKTQRTDNGTGGTYQANCPTATVSNFKNEDEFEFAYSFLDKHYEEVYGEDGEIQVTMPDSMEWRAFQTEFKNAIKALTALLKNKK